MQPTLSLVSLPQAPRKTRSVRRASACRHAMRVVLEGEAPVSLVVARLFKV